MKLLLATTNQAKLRELHHLLSDLPSLHLVTPRDLGTPPGVDETGTTFVENALLKAHAYAAWSGLPAIADDGGLAIDALGGEPGVRSRRWIEGPDSSDQELIAHTLARLRGVPPEGRGAAMVVAEALVLPGEDPIVGEGQIRGVIAERATPRLDPGFPFRSVFYLPQLGKYFVDLTEAEHEQVSHRRAALAPIRARLSRA